MLVVSKGDSSYEMKITVLTITSSGFKLNETNVRLHITYDQFFFPVLHVTTSIIYFNERVYLFITLNTTK